MVHKRGKQVTRQYRSFSDDFVENSGQAYTLPEDYVWLDRTRTRQAKDAVALAAGHVFSWCYTKVVLGVRIVNKQVVTQAAKQGGGFFLYANHTQPTGDACVPLLVAYPARSYVLVSPANLGIPGLGRLLPYLGALPVASTLAQSKQLRAAVHARLAEGHAITIYPEAHQWPWCSRIRPLPESAFAFPVAEHRPIYTATTTYQARERLSRPRITVYVDGPFWPDESLPRAQRKQQLCGDVQAVMQYRAQNSTTSYITYVPACGAPEFPEYTEAVCSRAQAALKRASAMVGSAVAATFVAASSKPNACITDVTVANPTSPVGTVARAIPSKVAGTASSRAGDAL